ncbi:hypothetical protein AVEN_63643-1 [Araneus ventricosus]|uniref:Uncharacterized protein n=1 Tax=Araneus ventricosus TaxID=182803 RepID=A0A4Y2SMU4_ARAVE|nr:hypothetical protein AVEN_63643-1 [Araneus ventricosus]
MCTSGERLYKCDPDCFHTTVKIGSSSLRIWAAAAWVFASNIINLKRRVMSAYVDILAIQSRPMLQTLFPSGSCYFRTITIQIIQPNLYRCDDLDFVERFKVRIQIPSINRRVCGTGSR